MPRYIIFDSAGGDELGTIEFDSESDEMVLETLAQAGYLDGPSDDYYIEENYSFAEGALVVLNETTNEPALTLEEETDEDDATLNGEDWEDDA